MSIRIFYLRIFVDHKQSCSCMCKRNIFSIYSSGRLKAMQLNIEKSKLVDEQKGWDQDRGWLLGAHQSGSDFSFLLSRGTRVADVAV